MRRQPDTTRWEVGMAASRSATVGLTAPTAVRDDRCVDERVTIGLRSLRRSAVGCGIVAVLALGVTVALVGSARSQQRVHRSGRIATAIVTSVHIGSKTNTAQATFESPEGTQRVHVTVRRGTAFRGEPLQVRYLPHVAYAEAVGPQRP